MRAITKEKAERLVKIGFCQPKFYKRSVWVQAKRLIDNYAVPNGLAYAYDLGRGKGKYATDYTLQAVADKVVVMLEKDGLIKV